MMTYAEFHKDLQQFKPVTQLANLFQNTILPLVFHLWSAFGSAHNLVHALWLEGIDLSQIPSLIFVMQACIYSDLQSLFFRFYTHLHLIFAVLTVNCNYYCCFPFQDYDFLASFSRGVFLDLMSDVAILF